MSAAKKTPVPVMAHWWQVAACAAVAVGIGICIGYYFCGGVPA